MFVARELRSPVGSGGGASCGCPYTRAMAESEVQSATYGPLLGTKFHHPAQRPGFVARPRLLRRLQEGTQGKLTLISAPAGFGKTSLMAEWDASRQPDAPALAWLSLDQSDNRPASFWTYVVAALQSVEPNCGSGAMALMQSPQLPPIELLLTSLLNEVDAATRPIVLVLDDYHLIETNSIHDGITFMLDHLPGLLRLVITGRSDPPLPLARMRARGELVEIRAGELRFTREETEGLLNGTMGLGLSAREITALHGRTEGWAAGLQLAALSIQGRTNAAAFIEAFAGDDRYIADYLVEEVLDRQTPEIRRFLLETSILGRLSDSLCNAVTSCDDAGAILSALDRGNLFVVPLDDRREWYRYHHLFAEVLRAHLMQQRPRDVPGLHSRASEWFAAHGEASEAVRHAMEAQDPGRAAGIVELEAEALVRKHQPDVLIEWVKGLPDEVIRSMPVLSTFYALALQGVGRMEEAAARLDDAERCLDEAASSVGDRTSNGHPMTVADRGGFESLPSRIALARSYGAVASGDVEGTADRVRQALALLPEDEHHWRGAAASLLALTHWARGELAAAQPFHRQGVERLERAGDIVLALSAAYHGGDLLRAQGRLVEAAREYERSLTVASGHGVSNLPGVANLHFGFSELRSEQHDFEEAARHLETGEQLGLSAALPATAFRHNVARARLAQSQGDLESALELLDEASALFVRSAVPDVRPVAAWRARLWIAQGRVAEAVEWSRTAGLAVGDDLSYRREYEHLTLARALVAQARRESDEHALRDARQLLERLQVAAEAGGRGAAVIEALLLRAIVHRSTGDDPSSLSFVERALERAESEGYVAVFVDEGEPMRDLLREAARRGTGGGYARRILAAFDTRRDIAPTQPRSLGLAEPLTPRELEILRLVAAGMRNQEIADLLVISLPTVKRHIANGYGKLGATHRTEAVARATELSLL